MSGPSLETPGRAAESINTATPRPPGGKFLTAVTGNWVFLALVVIIAFFGIKGGSAFFSFDNLSLMLANNSVVILLAIGMTFLIIGGQLDLSIGSVLVFSSVVGAKVIVGLAGTAVDGVYPHAFRAIVVGIVVSTLVGGAWGLFNGVLVTRLRIPSFIVTLGTLGMALGLAQVITTGTDVTGLPISMAPSSAPKMSWASHCPSGSRWWS